MISLMLLYLSSFSLPANAESPCVLVCENTCKPKTEIVKKKRKKRKAKKAEPKPPEVIERVVEKTVVKDETKKNSLSLLVPYAPTKLSVSNNGSSHSAETKHELDIGLLYSRHLGRITVTVGGTINGIGMLGLGANF